MIPSPQRARPTRTPPPQRRCSCAAGPSGAAARVLQRPVSGRHDPVPRADHRHGPYTSVQRFSCPHRSCTSGHGVVPRRRPRAGSPTPWASAREASNGRRGRPGRNQPVSRHPRWLRWPWGCCGAHSPADMGRRRTHSARTRYREVSLIYFPPPTVTTAAWPVCVLAGGLSPWYESA